MMRRRYGVAATARNVIELASPRIRPKVIFASCPIFMEKLSSDNRAAFIIADRAFVVLGSEVAKKDYKLVGAEVDSFLMVEMFGMAFPNEWIMPEDEARNYIFLALKAQFPSALQNITKFDDIPEDTWANMKATCDKLMEETTNKSRFFSLLASTIYSICRQGCSTPSTASHLAQELSTAHGFTFVISTAGVSNYWNVLGKTYSRAIISELMDWLLPKLKKSIRLTNLVEFSKKRGLNIYYQVRKAIATYPTFDWPSVMASAGNDFVNYGKALDLVKDRDWFGYNANIGCAAASYYPTLGFVSWKLNEIVGGETTLAHMNSRITAMVNTARWEKMIREYRSELEGLTIDEETRKIAKTKFDNLMKDKLGYTFTEDDDNDSDDEEGPTDPRGGGGAPSGSGSGSAPTGDDQMDMDQEDELRKESDEPPTMEFRKSRAGRNRPTTVEHQAKRRRDDTPAPTEFLQIPTREESEIVLLPTAITNKFLVDDQGQIITTETVWDNLASNPNVNPENYWAVALEMYQQGKIQLTKNMDEAFSIWTAKNASAQVPSEALSKDLPVTSPITSPTHQPEALQENIEIPPVIPAKSALFNQEPKDEIITRYGMMESSKTSYPIFNIPQLTTRYDSSNGEILLSEWYGKVEPRTATPADANISGLTVGERYCLVGLLRQNQIHNNMKQTTLETFGSLFCSPLYTTYPFAFKDGIFVTYPDETGYGMVLVGYKKLYTWLSQGMDKDLVLLITPTTYTSFKDLFRPATLGNLTPFGWALLLRLYIADQRKNKNK